jgi:Zn-finger nucleic acid-binding protein
MNCPVCKSSKLVSANLESNLTSMACRDCGGNWIRGAEYWKWLEEHGPNLPERAADSEGLTLAEPGRYIDCPECRFRMVKYLVGRGLNFTVDHCEGCKGIWLDRNEWEILKRRNLHDDLNSMLTEFWQIAAKREARMKSLEQIYVGKFGERDYSEIKRVRAWLDSHPQKQYLLAYLTDKDPLDL